MNTTEKLLQAIEEEGLTLEEVERVQAALDSKRAQLSAMVALNWDRLPEMRADGGQPLRAV